MHLCRSSSDVPCLPSFCKLLQNPHVWLTFHQVQNPLRLPHKNDAGTSKSGPSKWCFYFGLDMCFAPQRRHIFNISTSKSAPKMVCFVRFDFETCFAPHRRALFRHLNLQKWVRDRQFLTLLTSKCASRQIAVHFFNISTSKSAPNRPAVFLHFDFQMCFGTTAPCTF